MTRRVEDERRFLDYRANVIKNSEAISPWRKQVMLDAIYSRFHSLDQETPDGTRN